MSTEMKTNSFTCDYCDQVVTVEYLPDDISVVLNKSTHEWNDKHFEVHYNYHNYHDECQSDKMREMRQNLSAGTWASHDIFDHDENMDTFVIHYISDVDDSDGTCDMYVLNLSSRHERKGGEPVVKHVGINFNMAIINMHRGTNNATDEDVENALVNHFKKERKNALQEVIRAETDFLMESDYFGRDYEAEESVEHLLKVISESNEVLSTIHKMKNLV